SRPDGPESLDRRGFRWANKIGLVHMGALKMHRLQVELSGAGTLALALCAGSAFAQTAPAADTLKVDYFSYANTSGAPYASVRVINPGTAGGNICADFFVFDSYQE